MTNETERQLINLIAADRIYVPISSLDGKLKRMRPRLAKAVDMPDTFFEGERVYARVQDNSVQQSKGMRAAINEFSAKFPEYGIILEGMIAEKRETKETALCFGVNPGCKLTAQDYMEVMTNLGFNERNAIRVYPELMDASRKLSKARDYGERSILIGWTKYFTFPLEREVF